MDFGILGPLEVAVAGVPVELRAHKVRLVLVALLLRPGQVVSADALVDAVWAEEAPERATAVLQTYVSALRKALGADVIQTRAPGYVLAVEPECIDGVRFEALVDEGRAALAAGKAERAAELFASALSLWRGPALGEFAASSFVRAEAARLEELRLEATEEEVAAELAAGHHTGVVGWLRGLVEDHPLRERLWGQLALALYRSGRQADALGALAEVRRRLGEDLGIEPGIALRRLEADLLAQRPGLDWHPPAPPPEVPTNLRPYRSSFVGRDHELDALDKALAAPGLVTMVGPAGVGKTRLATEAARRMHSRFPDGVWLAGLAPVSDPSLLPHAVATACGVQEEPGRPLTQTLTRALAPKRALVVLDNCEHVVEAAAAMADALLAAAPNLAVLATSRQPLRVEGEVVWPTPTLPLAPCDDLAPEALAGVDALRLFYERAAEIKPFSLGADNASAVSALCRRLDGIPLAIELAAARTAALSPAQILDRLDHRFDLLSAGRRTLPRHGTLAAAVEWSHDLLGADERTLFRRLSVFRGFSLDAAEEVCVGHGLNRHQVAALLADLVDRSLVVAQPHDGGLRYFLLETLRAYAAERLAEAGEEQAVRGQHVRWAIDLVERSAQDCAATALAGIETELDNIRAAMEWSAATNEAQDPLTLALPLWNYWQMRRPREGEYWLRRLLAAGHAPSRLRARALLATGHLAWLQGHSAEARSLLEDGLATCRESDDAGLVAHALVLLGMVTTHEGDFARAETLLAESLSIYPSRTADALEKLGNLRWMQGDLRVARSLLEESRSLHEESGDRHSRARVLGYLAEVEREAGERAYARALLEERLAVNREMADKTCTSQALLFLARVARVEGDEVAAVELLHESITLAEELSSVGVVTEGLAELATLAGANGRVVRAARLWGAVDAMRTRGGRALPATVEAAYDRARDTALAKLGDGAFANAWAWGHATSPDAAVRYALHEQE